jgi:adenosylcobyric acid synthase
MASEVRCEAGAVPQMWSFPLPAGTWVAPRARCEGAGHEPGLKGALLVCGTASDVGKSRLVAGICRALARRGVKVAPFKGQNMSLNSTVTPAGVEIARSQATQAAAACTEPDVLMGPVLLKPSGDATSQLVVMGRPAGEVRPGEPGWAQERLLGQTVLPALEELRARYDVVVAEGAGGAGEVNLLDRDIANLPLARRAGLPAVLVADIERGGAFASIYGTVEIVPEELRATLQGFVVNKFRGDTELLRAGIDELEDRLGLRCLGVVPHLGQLPVDEEDSLALDRASWKAAGGGGAVDIAVIALPHIANFTDFSPLEMESGVRLRYVRGVGDLGDPDLVVLPGSKATVADLRWLESTGLTSEVLEARARGAALLGVCAGYQVLGKRLVDDVESRAGQVAGLGVLAHETVFEAGKTTCWRQGRAVGGEAVSAFEIHHGHIVGGGRGPVWFWLEGASGYEPEGVADPAAGVWATSLHGLFENDELRASFLTEVARRRHKRFEPSGLVFAQAREAMFERLADAVEEHLDWEALLAIIAAGWRRAAP